MRGRLEKVKKSGKETKKGTETKLKLEMINGLHLYCAFLLEDITTEMDGVRA